MIVYVCHNTYEDTIEGVYTEAGMRAFKEWLLDEAVKRRDIEAENKLKSIQLIKTARQPQIELSESLLQDEKRLKAEERWSEAKEIRRKRKLVLRDIERLNLSIRQLEDRWVKSLSMTTDELLSNYGDRYSFEEFELTGC